MKILITGGLGHIGSYFIENMNKIKIIKTIYIIDNMSGDMNSGIFSRPNTNKKIHFFNVDLSKKKIFK